MTKKRNKPPRTQYFSGALLLFMEKNHINRVQLSAATGIGVSRINNYRHGKYRAIRPDHLEALTKSALQTDAKRGESIRTYAILHEKLSDRELEILRLIASGCIVKEIAAELTLSVNTISTYRTCILAKMEMRTSAALTHYAISNGLVERVGAPSVFTTRLSHEGRTTEAA
jgi:DNA-binding NarL/FixJ family response regulator